MARKVVLDTYYTFTPGASGVGSVVINKAIPRERLILITNVSSNQVIYNFSDPNLKARKTKDNEEKKNDKCNVKGEETKIEQAHAEAHAEAHEEAHEEAIKQKYIYKNFITIIISALCLSISLGVNEVFLLYLRKKDTQDIVLTIKYVIVLIILTLGLSYYFNLGIE